MTDTLWITDTLYIHDTVYIHDTIYVGVDEVEAVNVKIYGSEGQVVVEGAEGQQVTLFDAVGRQLAVRRDEYGLLRLEVPATGTYLVKVGTLPARKIVVVR